MNVELAPGGFRESLTKNPGIIYTWPNSVASIDNEQLPQIFPNPASANCTIWFGTKTPNAIVLLNNMGQVVQTLEVAKDAQQMQVDLAGMQRNVYAVRCMFNDAAVTQRLVVN